MPSGGELFERFVADTCCKEAVRALGRVRPVGSGNEEDAMTMEDFNSTFAQEKIYFHGHVMAVCSRVNRLCQHQLYYHTLNAVFHGLSRSGREIQARFGHMMKLSTFDDTRRAEKKNVDAAIKCTL